jgi:O-antigen/teichoic acid export membrane protein
VNLPWGKLLPPFLRRRLEGRETLLKVAGNAGWLAGEKILRMGIGLFVGVWVARYLGPEQYGVFSYLWAFVMLFSPLARLGMEDIVVRNLSQDASQRGKTLGSAFGLMFFASVLAMVLAVGIGGWLQQYEPQVLWLLIITASILVFQSFDVIDLWFRSQVKGKPVAIVRSVAIIIVTGFNVAFILSQAPLAAFVLTRTLDVVLVAAGLYIVYRLNEKTFREWHFDSNEAIALLRDSWPLILSSIAGIIYLRIDQVMLTNMVSEQENGIYAAAVRLVELWYFVPMAIYMSAFPKIAEAKKVSEELFYARLQKLYNAMSFLAYAIAIPTTIVGGWVMVFLFGEEYAGATPMLIIMVWSLLFTNLGVARSAFLMSKNWTKVHTFTVFLGAIANILLNLWLLPQYGGVGAAIATLVAYWLAAHGSCFLYPPLVRTGRMLTRAMVYPKVW